jgi:hypothetical protein
MIFPSRHRADDRNGNLTQEKDSCDEHGHGNHKFESTSYTGKIESATNDTAYSSGPISSGLRRGNDFTPVICAPYASTGLTTFIGKLIYL